MPKIAVLVPCFNEEQTVEKVCRDFLSVLPEATVYVYDNASTDRTFEIASNIDPRVVVRKEYRRGKGNVARSMFRDIEADCYIMVDGDDTYPAEHAPEMIRLVLEERYDMVIGDRLSSTYFTENKRPFHNAGNVLVRSLVNRVFSSDLRDIMTGYRAFSRTFVKTVPIERNGFELETEMTINALDMKLRISEIPIAYRDRPEGSASKLNTFRDGYRVLKTILRMFRDYRPMLFFALVSAVLAVVALAMFIPVFIDYLNTGLVLRFPTLIVSVGFGISSLLSLVCGFILDVIVSKNRARSLISVNTEDSRGRG
ncbi:MAG: glycosyltransferase family 2 protein [Clostridia bacterium]|nr:glycosyltransferase family 2 protein [Clostridia bacterium]